MTEVDTKSDALELATELTVAWLSNPSTRASADDVPAFLNRMHEAVAKLSNPGSVEVTPAQDVVVPAVSVRKSLASKEHLISLLDGKPYKTLRRHLARNGFTPEQYRERFGLKPDYPMVSEAYSQVRRAMAQKIGLGRKPRGAGEEATAEPKPARGRGRKKPAAAE